MPDMTDGEVTLSVAAERVAYMESLGYQKGAGKDRESEPKPKPAKKATSRPSTKGAVTNGPDSDK